jgi:hypothetical protein
MRGAEGSGASSSESYWLTRFVLLRLLGAVYAVAFLVAVQQLVPLVGERGLTPANIFLDRVHAHFGSTISAFTAVPSIFWLNHSDLAFIVACWTGLILALLVTIGYANGLLLAVLWMLYLSIVHIGQDWYGYGWEIQLTETGFLAIFLCPFLDGRPFPRHPPPLTVI